MTVGRAILTHREELIPHIKRYYLDSGRTDFLVIAYNRISVNAQKFEQTANFKFYPYEGKGPKGNIYGQMFLVWAGIAENFPNIESWVMHDYDVVVNPSDKTLVSKISVNQYGMVGKPFVYDRETIENSTQDELYPFLKSGLNLSLNNETYKNLENQLLKTYPKVLTGYGDLIVARAEDLRLLGSPNLQALAAGGAEQVPHTVFAYQGIEPVDLKNYFNCFISLDNAIYADFESVYDISHPAKFWPGFKAPGLEMKLRRFLKLLLTDSRNIKRKIQK